MSTRLESLVGELDALRSAIADLDKIEQPTEDQAARFAAALAEWDTKKAEHDELSARAEKVASVRTAALGGTVERGQFEAPAVIVRNDPTDVLNDHSLRGSARTRALVDANLRAIEGQTTGERSDEAHFEQVVKRHAGHHAWAENILARSTPEYASAFSKLMTGNVALLDEAERTALEARIEGHPQFG